jgi:hypothetical protein
MTEAVPPPAAAATPRTPRRLPLGVLLAALGSLIVAGVVVAALLAGLPGPSLPGPEDSPPADVVDITPTPSDDSPTPSDDSPGNSGNAPGKEDKDDKKP